MTKQAYEVTVTRKQHAPIIVNAISQTEAETMALDLARIDIIGKWTTMDYEINESIVLGDANDGQGTPAML